MYLIITDDGEILRTDSIDNVDLGACDNGLISIINLNGKIPSEYYLGEWVAIDVVGD